MSIGIVLALKAEARAVLGRGRWQGKSGAGKGAPPLRRVKGGDGSSLIAALCGVGPKRAAAGAASLAEEGVDALLSVGISGGLSPALKAGDLVLASEVMDDGNGIYGVDQAALEFAFRTFKKKGLSFKEGLILSTESALLDKTAKHSLYDKTGAVAVDMESAGLASVAAKMGLPLFVLRAVCDNADEVISEDLYACLGEGGGVRPGQLLGNCVRRPAMVGEMMRLRRSYNQALSTLSRGWQALEEAGFLSFLASLPRGEEADL